MRQVFGLTSTYSSDEFGICSALYELGGMVVMHDASGCNSTYTTHDEPRWYEKDSMIFISAISEMEAIMGDDDKFIQDLIATATELKPLFIALVGAPIPYMIGTDMEAIAQMVEAETGIHCFGFGANGMQYYTKGISMAMERMVDFYCTEPGYASHEGIRVNILGATPLDFFTNGSVEDMNDWLAEHDMIPGTCFGMGCTLEDLKDIPKADVNLVVSYGGLAAAKLLEERFGMPYVVGVPYGEIFAEEVAKAIRKTAEDETSRSAWESYEPSDGEKAMALIGESITMISLACAIESEHPEYRVQVCCPLDADKKLFRTQDIAVPEEDDVMKAVAKADVCMGDPMYQPIATGKSFVAWPHLAFSGRMFENSAPNVIGKKIDEELKLC